MRIPSLRVTVSVFMCERLGNGEAGACAPPSRVQQRLAQGVLREHCRAEWWQVPSSCHRCQGGLSSHGHNAAGGSSVLGVSRALAAHTVTAPNSSAVLERLPCTQTGCEGQRAQRFVLLQKKSYY